jgi:hypothetical protein
LKILNLCTKYIFILCLPVLLLSGSLAWGFNSTWILEYGFRKYDVSGNTGLSTTELNTIAHDWVRYINSGDPYWHIIIEREENSFELFTEEEQMHFGDVKQLIRLDHHFRPGFNLHSDFFVSQTRQIPETIGPEYPVGQRVDTFIDNNFGTGFVIGLRTTFHPAAPSHLYQFILVGRRLYAFAFSRWVLV